MEEDFNSPPEHKILPQNIIFVRGNGDSPYYNFFTDKPQILQIPEDASFTVAHKKFIIQPRNCSTILKKTDLTQDFSAIRTCHLPDFQMIFCF